MNLLDLKLYLITANSDALDFDDRIRQAIAGGVSCVQYREKNLTRRKRFRVAVRLRKITNEFNIPLLINDDVDLAKYVLADGVHLGQMDTNWKIARSLLGPEAIIGLSIENPEQAKICCDAGVDYFGVGPIFPTASKVNAAVPVGIKGLKLITKKLKGKPSVAIGGIQLSQTDAVLKCGVSGIAVISGIMQQINPYMAAKNYREMIDARI